MEDRRRREGRRGETRKRFLLSSPPPPWYSSFVLSSQLSRQTRAQKRLLRRPVCYLHMMSISLLIVFLGIFFHRMLGSVNLTTVEVKGVAAALDKHAPKGESKGVKAYFRMDENGLLNLEKVGHCVSLVFHLVDCQNTGWAFLILACNSRKLAMLWGFLVLNV